MCTDVNTRTVIHPGDESDSSGREEMDAAR